MACPTVYFKEERKPNVGGAIICLLQLVHLHLSPRSLCPSPPLLLWCTGRAKAGHLLQGKFNAAVVWGTPAPLTRDECSTLWLLPVLLCVPNWSSHWSGVLTTCLSNPILPHSNCVGCVSTDYLVANAQLMVSGTARISKLSFFKPSWYPIFVLSEYSYCSRFSLSL